MKRKWIAVLVLLVFLAAAGWALFRGQGAYPVAPENAQGVAAARQSICIFRWPRV